MSRKSVAPARPTSDFDEVSDACHRSGAWLWVPLRDRWVDVTNRPEEVVRQEWIRRLVFDGGYPLDSIEQEVRSLAHGHGSPRADIVAWATSEAKSRGEAALLVVETKAGGGPILVGDYRQGNSYARVGGAQFLICANAEAHSSFALPPGLPATVREINAWPKRDDFADAKRLRKIRESLRAFNRDEFQKMLVACHNLLRDSHAMSPEAAFDTISKVLFIKINIERSGTHGTFTTEFIDQREASRVPSEPPVHESLFNSTKAAYATDELFDDKPLDISPATFRELVAELERFNLSQTGEDVKGIAFEQFLGRTFRGELGQFFTPRPVVNFMVQALNPREGELVCDPAAGSGGFLISVFDHVREQITRDIEGQKAQAIAHVEAEYPATATEDVLDERDARIDEVIAQFNAELAAFTADGGPADTRIGRLASNFIYGTDKESRAARTAKMNMIMHGDGHGGIHWHDGLIDINGIWNDRFDVVITNPPFGSTVKASSKVGDTPMTDVPDDRPYAARQTARYGESWKPSHRAVEQSRGRSLLSLYEVSEGRGGNKTEVLFVERCLNLLRPGGRLAIVLPNGLLNGASLSWFRRWVEGRAHLRAVIALPLETFKFSGASVAPSILILQRFTPEDETRWEQAWSEAVASTAGTYSDLRDAACKQHHRNVIDGGDSELKRILERLDDLGAHLEAPDAEVTTNAALVRGGVRTKISKPAWTGTNTKDVQALRRDYNERAKSVPQLAGAMTALRAELLDIDAQETNAQWEHVRNAFDYQVFMARPQAVGITPSGDTGDHVPNQLPSVLSALRSFLDNIGSPW